MADLGFLPAVQELLDQTAAGTQRLLFSATLDRGVDSLVRQYLNDPAVHAVATAASRVDDHGPPRLGRAARRQDRRSPPRSPSARAARSSSCAPSTAPTAWPSRCASPASRPGAIHGNLTQHARKRALDDFSTGHARVLVATDVAARGIHVDDVDLVVHYDPPADHKDYLHRSGRTARAGASGTVLSLITSDQVRDHQRLRERAGVEASAQTVVPGHPAVREVAESGEPIVLAPRRPTPRGRRATAAAAAPAAPAGPSARASSRGPRPARTA